MRVIDQMDQDPPFAVVPGNRDELLALFRKHPLSGLPVLKEGSRKLAGVVRRADLFRNPSEVQTALLMDPNPHTTYQQAPLREAAMVVVENRLRALPVVTGSNDLVGLMTPDLFLEALLEGRGRVQTFLHHRVVPIHQSTPAFVAMRILQLTEAPALPVLDDEAKIVGIVTDRDLLLRADVRDQRAESLVGIPSDEDEWNREGVRNARRVAHATRNLEVPSKPVKASMVRNVKTVKRLTTVGEAAQLMLEHHIHQVPVVDDQGTLLDLLTDIDLLEAIL